MLCISRVHTDSWFRHYDYGFDFCWEGTGNRLCWVEWSRDRWRHTTVWRHSGDIMERDITLPTGLSDKQSVCRKYSGLGYQSLWWEWIVTAPTVWTNGKGTVAKLLTIRERYCSVSRRSQISLANDIQFVQFCRHLAQHDNRAVNCSKAGRLIASVAGLSRRLFSLLGDMHRHNMRYAV